MALAEARGEARKIIRDAQLGVFAAAHQSPPLALGETIPLFIQLYARPKNRGWKESERLLDKFQRLFAKPLLNITRSDVVRVLDASRFWNAIPANRALSALKKLMNWALDRGMIAVNPIAGLKPPHRERARERVLSDEDLACLLGLQMPKVIRSAIQSECLCLPASVEARSALWSGQRWTSPETFGPFQPRGPKTEVAMRCLSPKRPFERFDLCLAS